MASNFHSPPNYWLDIPLVELYRWTMIAGKMAEKERARQNVQRIG
jgi:hypothetical protein